MTYICHLIDTKMINGLQMFSAVDKVMFIAVKKNCSINRLKCLVYNSVMFGATYCIIHWSRHTVYHIAVYSATDLSV